MVSPAILLLALLALPARSDDALERALRRQSASDARTTEQLVEQLVALGPGRIPTWFGWLAGEGVETLFLSGDVFRPQDWLVRPDDLSALARRTLAALPGDAVVAFLERETGAGRPAPEVLLNTFAVLEELGSARGLELTWRLAEEVGDDIEVARLHDAALGALTAILARDRSSWRLVARRLPEAAAPLTALVLEACREANRPEAQPLLLDLLSRVEDSGGRREVLTSIASVERRFPWLFDGQTVRAVQRCWLGLEPADRVAVAGRLGENEDPEAVDLLIELLASPDRRAQATAEAALQALAGLSHGRDVEAWKRWHERESAWWERESEDLFRALEGTPARAFAALETLARHPLHRRAVALGIGASLPYQQPDVLRRSCDFLVALGSPAALPALLDLEEQFRSKYPAIADQVLARVRELGEVPPDTRGGADLRRRLLGE